MNARKLTLSKKSAGVIILFSAILFFLCPAAAKIYAYSDYTAAIPVGYDKCTNCKTASPTAQVQISCPDPKCQGAAGTYSFDRYETDAKGTCHWIMNNGYWTLDLSTGVNPKSYWKVTIKNETECPNAGYFDDWGNALHNVCCFRNQTVNGSVSLSGLKGSCGGVTISGVQQANCAGCYATATIGTGNTNDSSETSCDGGCPFSIMTADIAYQIPDYPDYLEKFALGLAEGETKPKCFYFADGPASYLFKNITVSDSFLTQNECCQAGQGTVGLYLDPDYIGESNIPISEGGRGLNLGYDDIFNPFDDIVCEYKVPGDDATESYPAKLIARATTLTQGDLPGKILIEKTGSVERFGEEDGYTVYRWSIKGWDSGAMPGIFSGTDMEDLVKGRDIVKCEVALSGDFSDKTIESNEKPVNFCVRLFGSNAPSSKVVFLKDINMSKDSKWLLTRVEDFRKYGLGEVAPFNLTEYADFFSFYADLGRYNAQYDVTNRHWFVPDNEFCKVPLPSNNSANVAFYYKYVPGADWRGITVGGTAWGAGAGKIIMEGGSAEDIFTQTHEFGHGFCKLGDEYVYYGPEANYSFLVLLDEKYKLWIKTNCRSQDNLWPTGNADAYSGCSFYDALRPSSLSVMKGSKGRPSPMAPIQFNRVSCGYCLARLDNKSGLSDANMAPYWSDCGSMTEEVIQPGYNECRINEDCAWNNSGEWWKGEDMCRICEGATLTTPGACQSRPDVPDFFCRQREKTNQYSFNYGKCLAGQCQINTAWRCNIHNDCNPFHYEKQIGCWTCQDHQCSQWAQGMSCTKPNGGSGHCSGAGECI